MTNPAAPPGWYPDPSGNGGQSYWDGRAWQSAAPSTANWGATPGQVEYGHHAQAPAAASYGAPASYGVPQGYGQPVPYQQPRYPPQPYVAMVSPKSPGIALLLSFFWPGAGHLYIEGPTTRAILLMVGTFVSICLLIVFIGFLTLLGLVIWTMIESYGLAKQWNVARGFPPG